MNAIESTEHYKDRIKAEISNTLTNTYLKEGIKKTVDWYVTNKEAADAKK